MLRVASDVEVLPNQQARLDVRATLDYAQMLEGLGSKKQPSVINIAGYSVQMHADGACLEYAVLEPVRTAGDYFVQQYTVFEGLQQYFGMPFVGADWYDLRQWPALHEIPYLVEQVNTFGCDPDYNMFGRRRTVPKTVKASPIREAGLHFHFDLRPEDCTVEGCSIHAKAIANTVPHEWSCGEFTPWYRKPGVYRPKPYGIEYRSFGSGMLQDRNKFEVVVQLMFNYFGRYWQ